MLVLRKRKGCEEGASRPPYPVPDSGRGRAASDPGQYNHSLLPSGLSLPGGPDTDRQNEDVQTGVECGGQPDYGPWRCVRHIGGDAGWHDAGTGICALYPADCGYHGGAGGASGKSFPEPGVHWIFLSGDFHGVWIRQPGYGTIFAVAALYPCQYVPVSVIHCRAGVFRQARMDSSGRRKACVCPFHNHVHAVGNRYHRSCHYVQNHGRNRADQRAGGRDSKGTWQDLCHIGASGGNGGIVHDRKQYVI